jgi:hypothetical protein
LRSSCWTLTSLPRSDICFLALHFILVVWLQECDPASEAPISVLDSWFVLTIPFPPLQVLSLFVLLLSLLFIDYFFAILCTLFNWHLCYVLGTVALISVLSILTHAHLWVAASISPSKGSVTTSQKSRHANLWEWHHGQLMYG